MNDCVSKILDADVRIPVSTYRVQMHKDFTFEDAQKIVPYLKELGIGDFYSSPIFEARPGSMHGYDVTRQDKLNPELGGEKAFAPFSAALKDAGMGLLLDIVPNHMGVGNDTKWWQDVLENGHASEYNDFFDIDWDPLKPQLKNKLLLPILGGQYGDELEAGHIQVVIDDGKPFVQVFDHRMPVAPRTIPMIFYRGALGSIPARAEADEIPEELYELLRGLSHIPPHETTDPSLRAQRTDQLKELLPQLRKLLGSSKLKPFIDQTLEKINGSEGNMASFDQLHELLEAQPYRLALWRTSGEEINYRRFFDVNDLVGLRMENGKVFAATHCLIRKLLADHSVTGLRIDHCDGLYNPEQYLIDLQRLYIASQCEGPEIGGETDSFGIECEVIDGLKGYDWEKTRGPLYVTVEKILEPGEYMPTKWAVHGTSGYDFVYFGNSIFIEQANEQKFNEIYARIAREAGRSQNASNVVYRSKLQVMQNSLASEVHVLTNILSKIASADRHARDFTDAILEDVLRQTIACFPVYRTYIDENGEYTSRDRNFIQTAIRIAKRRNPDIDASAFDFLRDKLFLKKRTSSNDGDNASTQLDKTALRFALKFQQLTGPVMAKGVEDTTFYVYTRFISANEVGGSAESFGISLDLLHKSNQERLKSSPDTMLTTSTHDTKRSEDVRNRLNVLSEMPEEWSKAVTEWQQMNGRHKRKVADGRIAPDANEEYLLYQTIVGAWPWDDSATSLADFEKRLKEYSTKALSEAKVNLSWLNPDQEYVDAIHAFIGDILKPAAEEKPSPFVESLSKLLPQLRLFGAVNSLAQLVLKTTAPGVPDFYQGTEMWDLSLVDPDNRRPVDYELRQRSLEKMKSAPASNVVREITSDISDGRIKLWTMHRALELRQKQHDVFRHGTYQALRLEGETKENLIGFSRSYEGETIVTLLPRFSYSLADGKVELPLAAVWGDATLTIPELKGTKLRNVFTDEEIGIDATGKLVLGAAFGKFPVALLTTRLAK